MCEPTGNNTIQAALPGLDLLEIACQLRSQNQELLKIILRLEKALVDSQQQLQAQIRSSDAAEVACRQAQINAAQLASKLETAKQEASQQQWQVETLTEQLSATQEHISQLEEHCLLLQQDCQNHEERREVVEKQLLELRAVLQFSQAGVTHKSTNKFAETPLLVSENPLLYLESLPALPVDSQNWSLPILPPLTTFFPMMSGEPPSPSKF